MKYFILTITIVVMCNVLFSQAPSWLWAHHAGGIVSDHSNGIAIDSTGNCYVTGYITDTAIFDTLSLTGNFGENIFIAKYNTSGNCIWAKLVGSGHGNAIAVDRFGNSYITGGGALTAAKYDTNGNCLWTNQASGGIPLGNGIAVDNDGNCYITGYFSNQIFFGDYQLTSRGANDIFIAKLDTDGYWVGATSAGGTGIYENGCGISTDNLGNVYVTGNFNYTAVFDTTSFTSHGLTDMFIAKLDANLNWLWVKSAGGTGYDHGNSIKTETNGISYVTGSFKGTCNFDQYTLISNSTINENTFITKLDTNGNY